MAQALSNLPIGAKVKFGKYSVNGEAAEPIVWLVVAQNHSSTPAYPANSVTLLTEKIIDQRAFDAKEPGSASGNDRQYGSSRYSLSNIDQWLNKDSPAGEWYAARHGSDQPPSSSTSVVGGTQYSHRPGFLNAFSDAEKNSILLTSIRVGLANNSYEDIQREVFLASVSEVGLNSSSDLKDGSLWDYFRSNSRGARLTDQAYLNTLASSKPADITKEWSWALRSFNVSDTMYVVLASETSKPLSHPINGNMGIRPAINLSSNLRISDTQDSDGCYTIVWNSAPNAPSLVTAPATVYGGKSNPISWSSVTDPDGDAVTYQLECSIDNGAYTEIYRGTATTYAHLVPFGATFVAYRVKATDPQGASGAYTVSATKTVVNNNAPVISGADGNLGVKSNGFTGTYTITDANSDAVTVTEAIDGVQIRALVATLGQAITYGVTENTWLALPNGSHTLTITATDGIDTSVRTYVFTKLVEGFTIQNATPWASSTRPSRIMLVITRNIPSGAKFKVEVCNNGLQGSPTWEDCTAAVESGLVHVFSNQSNSAASWGVIVRVTVARNGATGACYVSAIGGNWE